MAGDLKGGSNVIVNFHTRVLRDAPSGTYNLPLNITYTYLFSAEQYGLDSLHYIYKQNEVNLDLPIHIKPKIIPEVSSVHAESVLLPGVKDTSSWRSECRQRTGEERRGPARSGAAPARLHRSPAAILLVISRLGLSEAAV